MTVHDGQGLVLPLERFQSPEEEKIDMLQSPWLSPTETWLDGVDRDNMSKTDVTIATRTDEGDTQESTQRAVSPIDAKRDASNRSPNALNEPNNTSLLSREEDDSDADFIQDDDDYDDDLEDELEAWDRVEQMDRVASNVRARPDSAMHGRRGASVMQSAPVSRRRLDAEEERELRIEAMFPCFASVFKPLVATKLAVGGSKVLLQYIERGHPEYCVEAIENGVRSLTKIASKDASSMAEASFRLVVMGNYCASLLMRGRQLTLAQKVLKRVQVLTSGHTGDFRRKTLFRIWTLCNLAILHIAMGMPVVAYEYLESALDHVDRHSHRGGQVVFALVRCAFFCSAGQFERAKGDATFAAGVMAKLTKEGSTLLGPAPNAASHHLSMVLSYNRALATLCCANKDVGAATAHAQAAWGEARTVHPDELSTSEMEDRRQVLRLRDTLARDVRDPLQQEYVEAVRAASLTPAIGFQASDKGPAGLLQGSRSGPPGTGQESTGLPEDQMRDGQGGVGEGELKNEQGEGEQSLRKAVQSEVDWQRVNGRLKERQPTLAETSAETLRGLLSRLKDAVEQEQQLVAERGEDASADAGVRPEWQEAYRRHIRTEWLVHAPVLSVRVSKVLLDFLKSLDSFFAAKQFTQCLEEVERLVEHIGVAAVVEALAESTERDVCICLCSAFVKFAIACSSQGNTRDAEAFYCYGMTIADRAPVSGIRGLLRAWMFDSMAFGHYKAGNHAMSLAALDAALKELRGSPSEHASVDRSDMGQSVDHSDIGQSVDRSDMGQSGGSAADVRGEDSDAKERTESTGEGGAGQRDGRETADGGAAAEERGRGVQAVGCREMEMVIDAHRVEVLLKMQRWMDALECGLELFREVQAAPAFLFPAARKGRVSNRPESAANRLRREAGMEMSGPGYRLGGGEMALFVPQTSLTVNHDILLRRRTTPRVVAHSREYVQAHVAHLTAAAAASLGREDDATSLFHFAKKKGDKASVEPADRKRRAHPRIPGVNRAGGGGWDGESAAAGQDCLQRQVEQGIALLEFTSREGAPPMSGPASSQVLLLAPSPAATSRPPSAAAARVPSRAASRPASAAGRPGPSMQERISSAVPGGSTARLFSRPKSAIAPGSPGAAAKAPAVRRPASALGIASVPADARTAFAGASSTDWAAWIGRRDASAKLQQQMREWDPRPPRSSAGLAYKTRPLSAAERPTSGVPYTTRPGSAVERARPSSAVRPGGVVARPGSAVVRRVYG